MRSLASRWNCSGWLRRAISKGAFELYRWFLPLLRMDTVPKFVQLIKLVQQETGMGSARVRPPRLELQGEELENARKVIRRGVGFSPDAVYRGQPLAVHLDDQHSQPKPRTSSADSVSTIRS